MKEFSVNKAEAGQSTFKFFKRIFKNAPDSFIYKMMRRKNFVLNDSKVTGKELLKEGDVLKAYISDDTFLMFSGAGSNGETDIYLNALSRFGEPDIIFENEDILIFDKPVGMLTQKASEKDLSANEWIIGYLLKKESITTGDLIKFKPSVCNRLDRNTGGLVLFGKTVKGTNLLNTMLRDRTLDKYYLSLCFGEVTDRFEIKGYLEKDERANKVSFSKDKKENALSDDKKARDSYTESVIIPLKYNPDKDMTEVSVKLITGKPHQIRAHLAAVGHPIVGDEKYGDTAKNAEYKGKFSVRHQILYCVRVVFPDMPDVPELSGLDISIATPDIIDKLIND